MERQRGLPARAVGMVAAAMFTLFAACATGESGRQDRTGLVGVIGHWMDSLAETPTFVVNGELWDGQASAASLRQASEQLFGSVNDAFVTNGSVPAAFPFAVAPDVANFTSGTLRVEFNMIGGTSDQIAGLLFGLEPSGDYHYVRYNTRDGNVAVWRVRNGEREVLAHGEVHKQLPLGVWHELVVRVRDREIYGYVAGDTTISVRHTLDGASTGRVGVWAKRDAITAFRGFSAEPAR